MNNKNPIILKLVSAMMMVLLFNACDNDDPSPGEGDGAALVGNWTVTSITSFNCTDAMDNQQLSPVCTDVYCLKIEFRADGTFTGTTLEDGATETDNGTYFISGDQLTVIENGFNDISTFTVSGSILTLNSSDQESGCDFTTTLTKN